MSRRYSTGRFAVVATVFALAFVALLGRFAWIQVVRSDHWRARAQVRSTDVVDEPARRGRLLDRSGRVLAATEEWTVVGVSRPTRWRREGDVARLAALLGCTVEEIDRRLRRDVRHVVLGEFRIDAATRKELLEVAPVSFERRARRVYPHGDVAASLLGLVRESGDGVTGLEAVFDDVLSGEPGRVLERRDAARIVRDRRVLEPPVDGADLRLTVDLHVQAIVERELESARLEAGAHRAQAMVLDPSTGDVIALAQTPADPEPLPDDPEMSRWRVMPATDVFEPGSVFKLFTAASLLRRGVCDTSTVFDGMREHPDQYRSKKEFPGGYTIRDVHPVGRVSLRHAFARSSNIVFATAALELLERTEIHDDFRAFGFGEYPGVGFPGETAGILRSPDDPRWSKRTKSTLAIGQEVAVSLLQLGAGAAVVLGDGNLRRPRFVSTIERTDGTVESLPPVVRRRGVVGAEVTSRLRAMTTDVVATDYGTGSRARVAGLEVGGKTGTAQVAERGGGYIDGIYNPTFIGLAPARDPRLVMVVVFHRAPGRTATGGGVAAPVFASIVREVAASTRLLDEGVRETVTPAAMIQAPHLVGRSVAEIRELAVRASWGESLGSLPEQGSVVAQIPPPGTPMRPGARIQVAFGREGR